MEVGFQADSETQRTDEPIENDGWFVDLTLLEFADKYGVPKEMHNKQLKAVLLSAIAIVNQSLSDYKIECIDKGYDSLNKVPCNTLAGISTLVLQYEEAVFSRAKVDMINEFITLTKADESEESGKRRKNLMNFYSQKSTSAIAKFNGKNTIGVYVI